MQPRAVIFDYDGLLVDTEDLWFKACQQVCAPFGVEVGEESRLELMRSALTPYLIERFSLPTTYEVLRPRLYGAFEELTASGLKLMPGARLAVTQSAARFPLAIGSGSISDQVHAGLSSLGLRQYFQVIVGSDLPLRSKPEPDIFLEAAHQLGISPQDCIVVEDNPKGVQAAKTAGMSCFVVPNLYLHDADYSQADRILKDLSELPALIGKLV